MLCSLVNSNPLKSILFIHALLNIVCISSAPLVSNLLKSRFPFVSNSLNIAENSPHPDVLKSPSVSSSIDAPKNIQLMHLTLLQVLLLMFTLPIFACSNILVMFSTLLRSSPDKSILSAVQSLKVDIILVTFDVSKYLKSISLYVLYENAAAKVSSPEPPTTIKFLGTIHSCSIIDLDSGGI